MTATIHSLGGRRSSPSLDPIMTLVAADLNHVNAVILERMQSEVILIPELAGHLIAGGGKRMRPMLTLASARLLDYQGTRQHKLAAAVEFIHTATLLHDDVVDGSGLRRGKRTANIIWGNPASVLVGDFLFSRSFELMVEDGSLKVLKILSHASNIIAEGEVNQLSRQRQVETSEDRYLEIISAKTAALFAAACKVSAVVAEREEQVEWALESYGRNLGIAFQLVDDAIDYAEDSATMGKDQGDDFRDGKVTLPVILAFARGGRGRPHFWRDAMSGRAHPTTTWPRRGGCWRAATRWVTRCSARGTMASARSTRWGSFRRAGPRRRWSRPSNSQCPEPTEPAAPKLLFDQGFCGFAVGRLRLDFYASYCYMNVPGVRAAGFATGARQSPPWSAAPV
jgi:octaprenyl-diphosphate synthase